MGHLLSKRRSTNQSERTVKRIKEEEPFLMQEQNLSTTFPTNNQSEIGSSGLLKEKVLEQVKQGRNVSVYVVAEELPLIYRDLTLQPPPQLIADLKSSESDIIFHHKESTCVFIDCDSTKGDEDVQVLKRLGESLSNFWFTRNTTNVRTEEGLPLSENANVNQTIEKETDSPQPKNGVIHRVVQYKSGDFDDAGLKIKKLYKDRAGRNVIVIEAGNDDEAKLMKAAIEKHVQVQTEFNSTTGLQIVLHKRNEPDLIGVRVESIVYFFGRNKTMCPGITAPVKEVITVCEGSYCSDVTANPEPACRRSTLSATCSKCCPLCKKKTRKEPDNQSQNECQIESQTESKGTMCKCLKWLLLVLIVFIGGVFVIGAFVLAFMNRDTGSPLLNASKEFLPPLPERFQMISYNVTQLKTRQVKRIAYGRLEDLTFEDARNKCLESNATLWEVESTEEWDAVQTELLSQPELWQNRDLWLNGKMAEDPCPNQNCLLKKNQANRGKGYQVRWLSDNRLSNYSRLSTRETASKKCLVTEDRLSELWTLDNCDAEHAAICVIRF